jgi:neutral peptidase B
VDPTIRGLKDDRLRLAWYVWVDGIAVFIDAQDGSTVFHYDDMLSAFDGLRIYDVDGGGQAQCETVNPVLDENGPYPGAPSVSADWRNNAARAQAEAKKAYEFFKTLRWNSYDNQGSVIKSCVRVKESNWDNRTGQWNPSAHCIYFYPGLPLAQDIAGHEFTHGVIQFLVKQPPGSAWSGGLHPWNESGALGESLADFFGSQIEGLNWTIGEDLPCELFYDADLKDPSNALPLRDMADPHKGTYSTTPCDPNDPNEPPPRQQGFYPNCPPWSWNHGQPDHYDQLVTPEQQLCDWKERGNGCIHINNGIFNKAMYLAANGGDHHNVRVKGIGKEKLVRIIFRALHSKRITQDITMKPFAELSQETCTQMSAKKIHQITQSNCDQVKNAFVAVGLMNP